VEAFFRLRATTAADSTRDAQAALKGGNVLIRPAAPSDWEAVRDIRLRSLREEPDAYASDYLTETRFEPDAWKQRLATAASQLAFDDDHALVGIATGLDTGDGDTYVVGMYVAPAARGSGCAQQLLDAIVELAVRRQRKRLVLEVADSNVRAIRFYRSYGFVATGRRRSLGRDPGIIEIEYEYPLPGRDTPHTNRDSDPSQAGRFRA
jgi:ribosomal protein S18 acetylase RimI-like enzyme